MSLFLEMNEYIQLSLGLHLCEEEVVWTGHVEVHIRQYFYSEKPKISVLSAQLLVYSR